MDNNDNENTANGRSPISPAGLFSSEAKGIVSHEHNDIAPPKNSGMDSTNDGIPHVQLGPSPIENPTATQINPQKPPGSSPSASRSEASDGKKGNFRRTSEGVLRRLSGSAERTLKNTKGSASRAYMRQSFYKPRKHHHKTFSLNAVIPGSMWAVLRRRCLHVLCAWALFVVWCFFWAYLVQIPICQDPEYDDGCVCLPFTKEVLISSVKKLTFEVPPLLQYVILMSLGFKLSWPLALLVCLWAAVIYTVLMTAGIFDITITLLTLLSSLCIIYPLAWWRSRQRMKQEEARAKEANIAFISQTPHKTSHKGWKIWKRALPAVTLTTLFVAMEYLVWLGVTHILESGIAGSHSTPYIVLPLLLSTCCQLWIALTFGWTTSSKLSVFELHLITMVIQSSFSEVFRVIPVVFADENDTVIVEIFVAIIADILVRYDAIYKTFAYFKGRKLSINQSVMVEKIEKFSIMKSLSPKKMRDKMKPAEKQLSLTPVVPTNELTVHRESQTTSVVSITNSADLFAENLPRKNELKKRQQEETCVVRTAESDVQLPPHSSKALSPTKLWDNMKRTDKQPSLTPVAPTNAVAVHRESETMSVVPITNSEHLFEENLPPKEEVKKTQAARETFVPSKVKSDVEPPPTFRNKDKHPIVLTLLSGIAPIARLLPWMHLFTINLFNTSPSTYGSADCYGQPLCHQFQFLSDTGQSSFSSTRKWRVLAVVLTEIVIDFVIMLHQERRHPTRSGADNGVVEHPNFMMSVCMHYICILRTMMYVEGIGYTIISASGGLPQGSNMLGSSSGSGSESGSGSDPYFFGSSSGG